MPNNTQTNLTIMGPKQDVLAFVSLVDNGEGDHFHFNGVVPRPDNESIQLKVLAWGTKWSAYEAEEWELVEGDPMTARISYQTAWTPATQFFISASRKFPSLKFRHEFADEGCFFVGFETFSNGSLNESVRYAWDSEEGEEIQKELGVYAGDQVAEEEAADQLSN